MLIYVVSFHNYFSLFIIIWVFKNKVYRLILKLEFTDDAHVYGQEKDGERKFSFGGCMEDTRDATVQAATNLSPVLHLTASFCILSWWGAIKIANDSQYQSGVKDCERLC